MSYDCYLRDRVSGETLLLDNVHEMKGGTYALSGTNEAWLNITFNYSNYYYEAKPDDEEKGIKGGIVALEGMDGCDSIKYIQEIIDFMKAKYPDLDLSDNYWESTPGNAIKPLYQLLVFARLRPDGVWHISY